MSDDFVEEQNRGDTAGVDLHTRFRQHDRDQQRLLFAGRALRRRQAARQMGDAEITAVGAAVGAAALGIAQTVGRQLRAEPVLDGERRHLRQPALDRPVDGEGRLRKRPDATGHGLSQALDQLAPGRRDGDTTLRDLLLERAEPDRIPTARAALPQQLRALLQRMAG